ncbi:MAG TPA: PfkB family carbohydrate kinase [Ktedonosporobacter sp.]|jgi:sugar/nucleoside kinase (ribokinase family)|nr:PfkB family carbohydrate kinase [Ktedonosporobacter sp.]
MPGFPDFLTIGHVARDLHPDGTFSLGGTVTFAALTAHRLGVTAGIVTRADPQLAIDLPQLLPDLAFQLCPSTATTTFKNLYHEGFRTQYLHARAEAILPADVPTAWRASPIVLLGPLAQELDPAFVTLFPRRPGATIAATPQGWLRRWDASGRVWPTPWLAAENVLPRLDALILSHDDLLPFANHNREEADAMLAHWSYLVPLLVATDGRYGATLFRHGVAQRFPAYVASEVDPTGAGDVFAAAFLIHLHKYDEPEKAVDFANCAASFSVQQQGIAGIPTLAMVEERLRLPDR